MNGKNPKMADSIPDFSAIDDSEDLPTGIKNIMEIVPKEHRPMAEIVYREHRWNHRFLKKLDKTLGSIRILMYLGPASVVAFEAIRWFWTHYH